jgi:error-prone DNA polymerase
MTHERSLEEMDEIGRSFVAKAVGGGVERPVAEEVFRQLRGFAAYGFNKAHAACFAIVCNASAWLKAHYPAEFFCGILNNQPMGFYSPRIVLNDARRFGIAVRPLDVNLSGEWFEVEDDGRALRVGLAYVKEMSVAARRAIVEARGDGRGPAAGEPPAAGPPRPYTSLADFVARTRVSREIAENLVRLGAFDALGVRREELVAQVPLLYAGARAARGGAGRSRPAAAPAPDEGLDQPRLALDEQFAPLAFLPSWSLQRRVSVELELLGLTVSAHPLRCVRDQLKALGVTSMARLPQVPHGRRVRLAGVLERTQMPWIRSGHRTLFLTLEDETELGQVVVFNDVYLKYGRVLKDTVYFLVEGELQNDEEHGLAVVARRIVDLTAVLGHEGALLGGGAGSGPGGGAGLRPAVPHAAPTGSFAYQRPDAWELPAVEPRTRPGRTG